MSAATTPSAKPTGNGDKDIEDQVVPPKRKNWDFFIPPETRQKHNTLEGAHIICPFQILLADLFFTLPCVSLEDHCPVEPGGLKDLDLSWPPLTARHYFLFIPLTAQANLGVLLKVRQLLHNDV